VRLRHLLLPCAVVLLASPAAQAEIAVRLTVETASHFVNEPFTLRLEVESDSPPETPRLPDVPGLSVVGVRRLPSNAAARKHVFQIDLIAERDGLLVVPPFAVRVGAESAPTVALRLRVGKPRPATEMGLAITIEPAALRVGQPAIVTVTWTSATPFSRCKQLVWEIPLLADPRCQVFPLDPPVPEAERVGLPVNNLRVFAQAGVLADKRQRLTFRYALVPREPCVLRTPPARLVCAVVEGPRAAEQPPSYFYNQFFSAPGDNEVCQRVYLAAPVPEITARALAAPGRSSCYAGIVGPCELRATVAPATLVVGQPALLTVSLENLAFARQLADLPAAAFAGLRPEFRVSAEPIRETATDHARSFTHIIRPLRPGVARVPAIVIQTFDLASGGYRTLRSAPLAITVEPVGDGDSPAVAPRIDAKPPLPSSGIRQNRVGEQTMIFVGQVLEFCGRCWWILVPLPPLLWWALRPVIRRRERCRRDPVFARATAALGRFRRRAGRDEETAWKHYLADRLALCAEALTADTVTAALRRRQVDGALIAETRRHFEDQDAVDYGRRPPPPARSTRNLVRRLQKATVPLLLVSCLGLPSVVAAGAESPDELFAQAVRLRGEQPDAAQPLLIDAALQFESAGRFLNAGNAWFFAGENGRALANYRAAQRRSPFDPQVRESIEFVRANRADALPPPGGPAGGVTSAWTQFGTWMPALRGGLFVILYLAAWAVFLVAQLQGWRIRRAIAVAAVVVVLAPLVSLAQTSLRPAAGVVVEDGVARLGPGYAYDAAFQQPLHKAAEFAWIESRDGWVRSRLPDGAEGWLPEADCLRVP